MIKLGFVRRPCLTGAWKIFSTKRAVCDSNYSLPDSLPDGFEVVIVLKICLSGQSLNHETPIPSTIVKELVRTVHG
jgi:hypothetical protein